VKFAVTLHCAPDARFPTQVFFVILNGCPLQLTEATVRVVVPELVRVAVSGALVVPISCVGNVTGEVGEKIAAPVLSIVRRSPYKGSKSITSSLRSPLKSPTPTNLDSAPAGNTCWGRKEPSPLPSIMLTLPDEKPFSLRFETMMSGFPSPSKSPVVVQVGK
jgi:hypothetical protein